MLIYYIFSLLSIVLVVIGLSLLFVKLIHILKNIAIAFDYIPSWGELQCYMLLAKVFLELLRCRFRISFLFNISNRTIS